jgi:hypothetical protein
VIKLKKEDKERAKEEFKLTKDKNLGLKVAQLNKGRWVNELKILKIRHRNEIVRATECRLYWNYLIELYEVWFNDKRTQ